MKVLQVGKYYYPHYGGMEIYLSDLCEELKDRVELQVLVANGGFRTVKEHINGINIIRVGRVFDCASISFCPLFPYYFNRFDPDIIHIHFPNPMGELSYFLSDKIKNEKNNKEKLVVSYHSDIIKQKNLLKLYAPMVNSLLSKADCILAHSGNYIEGSRFLKKYRSKCRVIPIGTDSSKFIVNDKIRRKLADLNKSLPDKFILFIGRLVYYKGLDYLLDAMKDVSAHLVIIGTGPLEKELKKKAESKPISGKIIFTGNVTEEEKIAYLHLCEFLVLPSIERSEAYGIVQLEAMACGKPVVSTDIPGSGISFVNQGGKTGFLVPPKNPEALTEKINMLLSDENLRDNLGEYAKQRVAEEFSRKAVAEKIYAVYKELLS